MLIRLAGVVAVVVPALAAPAAPSFVEIDIGFSAVAAREVNWGDYDNDGDLDVALEGLDAGTRVTRIYRNTSGAFAHETNAVFFGYNEGPIVFGDYDNDGDLDLAFGGWGGTGTGSRMHRNDGGGIFPYLDNGLRGMKGADGAWADVDNDGDLDLILVGESYDLPQGDYAQIYRNDGNDVFTLVADLPGVYLGEVAVGDYDRDGDVDLALTGRTVGSRIYRNDGGIFTDLQAGLPALMNSSVAWADIDNDGDLDLALCGSSNGSTATHFAIYENVAGAFTALPLSLPAVHSGELDWADYDNDGD
ncbi:MAG TPA: VCBS repeat-containing protein, partial [Planctomycetota bacterium]|nr:VCBS repeat-containing protein [Planctomycetota bacterium]